MTIQSNNFTNQAGDGLPNLNGTSPSIKWQRKDLSTDKTANTDPLSELSFNGLSISKTYKIYVQGHVNTLAAPTISRLEIHHDGSLIAWDQSEIATSGERYAHTLSVIFLATTTSIVVKWFEATGQAVLEGTIANACYSIIEELPYHLVTTDFT